MMKYPGSVKKVSEFASWRREISGFCMHIVSAMIGTVAPAGDGRSPG